MIRTRSIVRVEEATSKLESMTLGARLKNLAESVVLKKKGQKNK